jgi:alpha-tubulin suppressor-like RCC1 family protein
MFISPLKPVKSISNVLDIACMSGANYLDKSSYVWAFGGSSQLVSSSIPTVLPLGYQFTSLVHGGTTNNYAALDASSFAWVWGTGNVGSIGNNNNLLQYVPQSVVGGRQWLSLYGCTPGSFFGLDYSSYAWAWGQSTCLGDGALQNRSSPVSVIGDRQFIKLKAFAYNVYALDFSSYLWAWGTNSSGALGNNSILSTSSPISVIGDRQFIDFWIGPYFTIAKDSSSYLWAWGNNTYGSYGNNTTRNASSPISVLDNTWKNFYIGGSSNAAVFGENIDGNIYSWGYNNNGVLGQGTTSHVSMPTLIKLPFVLKKLVISNNPDAVVALDTSSNVWSWGKGSVLGNGQNNDSSVPNKPTMFDRPYTLYTPTTPQFVIPCQSTGSNTIFLDVSSYAWGWGSLYPGNFIPKSFPTNKQWCDLRVSCDASAGNTKIVGLDSFSYAWMWGFGANGLLGNNNIVSTTCPESVVGNIRWSKVVPSESSTYGIDISSYLWSWGNNTNGNLGNNTIIARSSPISVIGNRQVLKVVNATSFGGFLDSSSYAWAFGQNGLGYLGDGTITSRSSPVSVIGGRQFLNLGCSQFSMYGLDSSSYLWAWGSNNNGALGDNTGTHKSSPVSVVGDKQFISLPDNNTSYSMWALDSSSYLWVWGVNNTGALGVGDALSKSSPTSFKGDRVRYAAFTTNSIIAQINFSQYYYCGAQQNTVTTNNLANFSGTGTNYSTPFIVTFPITLMLSPVLSGGRKSILGK